MPGLSCRGGGRVEEVISEGVPGRGIRCFGEGCPGDGTPHRYKLNSWDGERKEFSIMRHLPGRLPSTKRRRGNHELLYLVLLNRRTKNIIQQSAIDCSNETPKARPIANKSSSSLSRNFCGFKRLWLRRSSPGGNELPGRYSSPLLDFC